MADPNGEPDRLAIRHCRAPRCGACGPMAGVYLVRYRPDGRTAITEAGPFPVAGSSAARDAALAGLEAGLPGAERWYEVCRAGTGLIRATRAGWLARLGGGGNSEAPAPGYRSQHP